MNSIWIFLFLFWMEADGIHKVGQCDTKQISDLVYIYFIVGWIWLLNPLIFCMATCLCLPVLFLLLWIFRKPQQTPASQVMLDMTSLNLFSQTSIIYLLSYILQRFLGIKSALSVWATIRKEKVSSNLNAVHCNKLSKKI